MGIYFVDKNKKKQGIACLPQGGSLVSLKGKKTSTRKPFISQIFPLIYIIEQFFPRTDVSARLVIVKHNY
jgi:hypothetical protein